MSTETNSIIHDIIYILDESGSMSSMGEEPLQAVNKFITDQKTIGNDGSKFSLWKFNSEVIQVIDDQDIQTVGEIVDYNPTDMTALYDAIGKAITSKKKKENHDNVICVILTDGNENSSKEFTVGQISKLIEEMKIKHNWVFSYSGANHDVFAVGRTLGIDKKCCTQFDCSPGEMVNLVRETSAAILSYRQNSIQGVSSNFSTPTLERE